MFLIDRVEVLGEDKFTLGKMIEKSRSVLSRLKGQAADPKPAKSNF